MLSPDEQPAAHAAAPEPPPVGPLLLEVEGLAKAYGDTWAVHEVSFALRAGEILGLVGPNGAGKTTTLRTVAGVLPIERGGVRIAGCDLARDELGAKAHLAWVPDQPRPFEALTIWEHLEFAAALYRVRDWKDRANDLLERFHLTDRRDALGGELSRGMCQKLALSMALLHEPQVLLLDEPLSGLDPVGIRAAKRAIAERAAKGGAVVLSSHLLGVVEELSTRLAILRQGRVLFDGHLDEARERANAGTDSGLEAVFFAVTDGATLERPVDAVRDVANDATGEAASNAANDAVHDAPSDATIHGTTERARRPDATGGESESRR